MKRSSSFELSSSLFFSFPSFIPARVTYHISKKPLLSTPPHPLTPSRHTTSRCASSPSSSSPSSQPPSSPPGLEKATAPSSNLEPGAEPQPPSTSSKPRASSLADAKSSSIPEFYLGIPPSSVASPEARVYLTLTLAAAFSTYYVTGSR